MTNCPIYGDNHKFFVFKTYDTFEPVNNPGSLIYYIKAEYAVLDCNCSATIKRKITDGDTI